jgi:hypothetical protein
MAGYTLLGCQLVYFANVQTQLILPLVFRNSVTLTLIFPADARERTQEPL